LDLSSVWVLDTAGKVIREAKVASALEVLRAFLRASASRLPASTWK
jgi:hypothetical protein